MKGCIGATHILTETPPKVSAAMVRSFIAYKVRCATWILEAATERRCRTSFAEGYEACPTPPTFKGRSANLDCNFLIH